MRDLIAQERFEMEVLDNLHKGRFLPELCFGGGTMLRLCHGLDRYSVDLDFWLADPGKASILFEELGRFLARDYVMRDMADKRYTLVFEFRSQAFARSLKIEIRKVHPPVRTEQAIAYSPHSKRQVLVRAMALESMMALKTAALIDRGEIRDAYDMEFLVRRGVLPAAGDDTLRRALDRIAAFRKTDYTAKLGSLIEPRLRPYYRDRNFRLLKTAIENRLGDLSADP